MADAESLSLAFIRSHATEAARVLETLAAEEVAAFLERVPARLAAPVIAAMLPNVAARSLTQMTDEHALALLGTIGTQPVVAILRHVAAPRRAELIARLPTATSLAARMLLGYVEDSVGAWTDPDVLALPSTTRAGDALERLRHVAFTVQCVFVTAANARLQGWVPISTLLRAPPASALATLMSSPESTLSARAPLLGASAHPGWQHAALLPVVESGRLLGVLSRDALTRASRRSARPAEEAQSGNLLTMITQGYWDVISGAVAAMTTLLPQVRPIGGAAMDPPPAQAVDVAPSSGA